MQIEFFHQCLLIFNINCNISWQFEFEVNQIQKNAKICSTQQSEKERDGVKGKEKLLILFTT